MARIKGVGLDMEQSKKLEDTLLWKSYCEKYRRTEKELSGWKMFIIRLLCI